MKSNPFTLSLILVLLLTACAAARNPDADSSTPDPTKTYFWIEAEAGAVYKSMIVKSDQAASNQIFITSYRSKPALDVPPPDGYIDFTIDIRERALYRVWARVQAPREDANSFWMKLDDGPWFVWEHIGRLADSWCWDYLPTDFLLETGPHTLRMTYRENNVGVDKLLLTDDLSFTPDGMGKTASRIFQRNNFRSSVVDRYGNLQVIGTRLCDQNGEPVQLRGVSTHGLQWFPAVIGATIPNAVEALGIDIIRPALYIEDYVKGDFWNGYLAHPEEMKAMEKDLIEDAIAAGVYVVIDWHIHTNPTTYTEQALDFFTEMSALYGGYPNVLFEICNEPDDSAAWFMIKRYAERIIPAIRENDPDDFENIIIIGTPNWCQYVDLAADDPLIGYTNIMYALHFYAGSHKEEFRMRARDALDGTQAMRGNLHGNKIPLIVTEWSACDYGANENDFAEAQQWLDFINERGISWIFWALCNKDEASSIFYPDVSLAGPWKTEDYTPSGVWIRERIQKR
ncbi:MAG TPA: hypothetical protein ENN69_04235 [Spirochaetia bacterium]|nr:hypothetical protein [Spirochaetia bacterium]